MRKFTLIETLAFIMLFSIMCSYTASLLNGSLKTKHKLEEVSQRNISIETLSNKIRQFSKKLETPVKISSNIVLSKSAGLKVIEGKILFIEVDSKTEMRLPKGTTLKFSAPPTNKEILFTTLHVEGKKNKTYTIKTKVGEIYEKK